MPDLTPEELKRLSPEERIKYLREQEEQRKKALEAERKKVEDEIAAAEELIQRSEKELDEQAEDEEKAREKEREKERKKSEEDLESRVGTEKPKSVEEQGKQYDTKKLYDILERAAENLNDLYGKNDWDKKDQTVYEESKHVIERARTYKLSSEKLSEDLGLASTMLDKLRYRH